MDNSLTARDKKLIWHPYTPQKYTPDPISIVKGEGVYLIDADGNRYIDAISSWWVNLHGHANKYIADKIHEQAKTLEHVIFAGFTHPPAVELAEKLVRILPGGLSKIFYSDNGSTAVEVALKMSLQYWWNEEKGDGSGIQHRGSSADPQNKPVRNKILALTNSYHGDTFGAMSVSERGIFTLAFQDKLFEVLFVDPSMLPGSSSLSISFDEIACFIYEPLIQGAGGMKIYDQYALDQFLQKLKEYGVVCIADEVMTGFGRTGKIFASEYMQAMPDIICLSKGLTGGTMAMGVTACSKRIHDAFVSDDRSKTFFHGHSYTANPLACTAALASMELLLREECTQNIQRISTQHQGFLKQLAAIGAHEKDLKLQTKNHRAIGTILAFEIDAGTDSYLNNISSIIARKSLEKGVLLRPLGNTVYIMPPYCITELQLQKIYETILEILAGS